MAKPKAGETWMVRTWHDRLDGPGCALYGRVRVTDKCTVKHGLTFVHVMWLDGKLEGRDATLLHDQFKEKLSEDSTPKSK